MNIPLSVFVQETAKETSRLLGEQLPAIAGDEWWKTNVVAKLSHQQQKRVERGEIKSLEDMDLAALIRVFDKNWHEISEKADYPQEARNLVREVKEVRDRAAHEGAAGQPPEDEYRDQDTLKRYLALVGADADLLEKLEGQRKLTLAKMTGVDSKAEPKTKKDKPTEPDDEPAPPPERREEPAPEAPTPSEGVPLEFLSREAKNNEKAQQLLAEKTFIGIDFGTSTTVASYVQFDAESGALTAIPIPVKQYDDLGRCIEDHHVASCIAWTGADLLVGQGAARLKSEYESERNIWFSFKMRLGIDLGPQYYRSKLTGTKGPAVIEKPQHAAAVFFRYLREKIEAFIAEKQLPGDIVYSVSVPAAFEANQRQDLCNALGEAGITLPEYGIIDEPNAAFISYLMETLKTGTGIAESMGDKKRNILVFDFGAGTCDISVLQVSTAGDRFILKNLAISQFHALGGDNIDRQIVREALLDQLFEQYGKDTDFTSGELTTAIIPRLQQAAEDLKIQCCKYIANNWDGKNIQPFVEDGRSMTGSAIGRFKVRGIELELEEPTLSYARFAEIMEPFLDPEGVEEKMVRREEDLVSIFEPVFSAMDKAELSKDQLDMILFIGGSSLNPFVQSAIQEHFGRFVECVAQGDLRTPVSRGAAVNSFMVNGLKREVIRPITSEPVYVVTKGGGLREILPAGSEIPSPEFFVSDLEVYGDGQTKVELPICVTSEDKVLAVVEVNAPQGRPYAQGETITLTCSVDRNKLLHVKAKIGSHMVGGTLINPLANKELTPAEARMLSARQHLHISALKGNGRPSVEAMLHYAYACAEAEHHLEAAEAFEAVERLDPSRKFATSICYHYSMAGKRQLSDKWGEIDYKRFPTATAAFNLALRKERHGDVAAYEKLMDESLAQNPEHEATLDAYGHYLKKKGNPKGMSMLEAAFEIYKGQFKRNTLDVHDFFRFRRVAKTLGRANVVKQLDLREKDMAAGERQYSERNLAVASAGQENTKGSP